ncbi:MAG: hypothetical protein ACJ8F7_07215 [Gemmataceae bacterium]
MSQPVPPPAAEIPRGRWLLGLMILIPVILTAAVAVYRHKAGERRLQAEEARAEAELTAAKDEATRLDGPWSTDALDARREAVPDDEDSARTLAAVKVRMPDRWPVWERVAPPANIDIQTPPGSPPLRPTPKPPPLNQRTFTDLAPPALLSSAQLEAMRSEMKRAADALALARRVAVQPRGRLPFTWPNTVQALWYDRPDVGSASNLLSYDVVWHAQEGHLDEALRSCRAFLNVAGAIGDMPGYPAQENRTGIQFATVVHLERIMAMGEPPAAALAAFQDRLAAEAESRPMLAAARGERAGTDRLLQILPKSQVAAMAGDPRGLISDRELLLARAAVLRKMTRRVEILKLPPQELDQLRDLQKPSADEPAAVQALFHVKANEVHWPYILATLRSGIAALAVERYRQKHSRWPDKLADLVPEFLPAVPADPCDGAPLRYQRLDAGVAIYSAGRDRRDDGGRFETLRNFERSDDTGVRLWNPDRRRQAAK